MDSEQSDKHNNMASLDDKIGSINTATKSKFFNLAKTPTLAKREMEGTNQPLKKSKSPVLIDQNSLRRNSSVSGNRSP